MRNISSPLPQQHPKAGWISLVMSLFPFFLKMYAETIAVLFFDASSYNFYNVREIEHTKFLLFFIPSVVVVFIGINLGIAGKTTIAKIGLVLNILVGIVLLYSGAIGFLFWNFQW